MNEQPSPIQFEEAVLPHLDAAYNLARWLTRNDHDAEDVVQDACVRAFKFFGGYRGGNSRAWLLSIVRNTGYNWLEKNRKHELTAPANEEIDEIKDAAPDPATVLSTNLDRGVVLEAVEALPVEFREVVVLRELEELSYKEIADVAGIPIGTVMSRLARARKLLQQSLSQHAPPPKREIRTRL